MFLQNPASIVVLTPCVSVMTGQTVGFKRQWPVYVKNNGLLGNSSLSNCFGMGEDLLKMPHFVNVQQRHASNGKLDYHFQLVFFCNLYFLSSNFFGRFSYEVIFIMWNNISNWF